MSLAKALDKQKQMRAPATKNRVLLLLEELHGTEDEATLRAALHDNSITHAVLTRTLWNEFGEDCVKSNSVREYRVNIMTTLNGL